MAEPNNIKSIFLDASEKPLAERATFLDEAVAGDATLRRRVEALLRAHDNPDSFLEDPARRTGPIEYRELHQGRWRRQRLRRPASR